MQPPNVTHENIGQVKAAGTHDSALWYKIAACLQISPLLSDSVMSLEGVGHPIIALCFI